jgi:arylsulfatase A-like enzyme
MATASDSILANVTAALKRRAMYKNTLIVHLSDNVRPCSPPSLNLQAEERHFTHQCPCDDVQQGGPVGACCGAHHANNWPLRGPHCAFSSSATSACYRTSTYASHLRVALVP